MERLKILKFNIVKRGDMELLRFCTLHVNTNANALKYIQEIDSLF